MDKSFALERLQTTRGFVFDMDGTLVLGDKSNKGLKPLPGAVDFIQLLKQQQIPYIVFTNGTPRVPAHYAETLRKVGFELENEMMMTPSSVAMEYFSRQQYKRILVLGCEGVWRPLEEAGIEVVLPSSKNPGKVDGVYVGWYKEFTLSDLDVACEAVWQGANLYSASMVPFFASAHGKAIGTSYVIVSMIRKLTRAPVKVLGKPSLEAMRSASRRLGVKMRDMTVVGDDPLLEISMAHKGKALAVAVHTGLNQADDFAKMPEKKRPHLSLHGIQDLLELYCANYSKKNY